MGYEPHLISPFVNSGLSDFFKPFLIGETAFPNIQDAYAYRGSVRKREGYSLFGTIPTAPVQGLKTWINPNSLVPNLIVFSLTKSYAYGNITNVFTDITQLAYLSTPFSFATSQLTQFQYYWTSNYQGSMWTTNGLPYTTAQFASGNINGIFYLTVNAPNSWNIHTPQIDGTPTFLNGCLIIMPYKGYLVVLNTFEGNDTGTTNQSFPNRARWSQQGIAYSTVFNAASATQQPTSPPTPFVGDVNSWRSDIPGKGGFTDADTSERIVSAAIINDVMVVGFQRSVWRLSYTGNKILPFIWERLNTQYGAESTFSVISFDRDALFYSRFGWISSSTNEVNRIDENIPDASFSFETGDATSFEFLNTVQGIRDYYRQIAYWTFSPIGGEDQQIFMYNYIDKSWSIFNPTNIINCFGEFFNTEDHTWASYVASPNVPNTWASFDSPDDVWQQFGSSQNQGFPVILGGDQATTGPNAGNIYLMFEFQAPATTDNNVPFNFNITTKRFNPYFERGQKCRLGYVDLYVTTDTYGEVLLQHFVDDKPYPIFSRNVALYSRGVLLISAITVGLPTTITTVSAHNLVNGQQVVFSNVNGSGANILNNQTYVVTVIDALNFTIVADTSIFTFTNFGYIWLPPFDEGDVKYTRVYLGAVGYHHQLVITLSDNQMLDPIKGSAEFELQGLVLWTRSSGGMIRG